jgi:thiosulfate/3-mercaptopyruvate sulfurtransferase
MNVFFLAVLAAALAGPLDNTTVSTTWLEQNLTNQEVIIVEVGPTLLADKPHIPGSRFIPYDSLVVQGGWPPDEIPPLEVLKNALGKSGVGDEGKIVLYSRDPLHATRAWFTLDYLGHGQRTAILDGGFTKWANERRPVTQTRFSRAEKTFTPQLQTSRRVTSLDVRNGLQGGLIVIDARPAPEFEGVRRGRSVARAGHIAGARSLPWTANLTVRGEMKPLDELRAAYAALGVTPESEVIVYCRTGVEASVPYFVLRSLGYNVRLYDGSYTEWSRDEAAPIALGAAR